MESININHAQVISSTINAQRSTTDIEGESQQTFFTSAAPAASPSTQVTISPMAATISDLSMKSRFTSLEELSAHKTKLFEQVLTTEEILSGTRRPFASAEDERLSHLTVKQLMEESNKLPAIDAQGQSLAGIAGTEQADRISVALMNLLIKTQVQHRDAAANVEQSLVSFKSNIEDKLKISSQSYDIIFKDGKATAIGKVSSMGKTADAGELEKVQTLLDKPDHDESAKSLLNNIDHYNKLSWQMIDNELTQHIYGAEQDNYLPKNVSLEWLLEGTNYSSVAKGNSLYDKYVELAASASKKYLAALEDGSHFAHSRTDLGILEATKIRESLNTQT